MACDATTVTAVQLVGRYDSWPSDVIYVGMPGRASRGFGIPDSVAHFGKPWACLESPLGWQTAYLRYLVSRLNSEPMFELAVKHLHGMRLACWCVAKPSATHCHAFILREFVEMLAHE